MLNWACLLSGNFRSCIAVYYWTYPSFCIKWINHLFQYKYRRFLFNKTLFLIINRKNLWWNHCLSMVYLWYIIFRYQDICIGEMTSFGSRKYMEPNPNEICHGKYQCQWNIHCDNVPIYIYIYIYISHSPFYAQTVVSFIIFPDLFSPNHPHDRHNIPPIDLSFSVILYHAQSDSSQLLSVALFNLNEWGCYVNKSIIPCLIEPK